MPDDSRSSSASLAALLALWVASALLIGVGGNFPLSDDWAYAHVVRSLCEGRGLDLLPWTGASLVLQAAYGAAACMLGGFSHETLRLTTLAMSVAGITAVFALLRELGAAARVAAAGAAVVAFSPLWLNLSFTFMTDVPFAALAVVAAWLYVRAFRTGGTAAFVAAGAVAAAAFLIRQHALWIAAAASLALLVPRSSEAPLSQRMREAAASLALPLFVAAAYAVWASTSAEVPVAVRNKVGEAVAVSPLAMAGAGFRALATLGFVFVPWAIATRRSDAPWRTAFAASAAVLGGVAAFLWVREGQAMFYLTNVLGDWSVGALTTRDVLFLDLPLPPEAHPLLRFALTIVSLGSAAALAAHLALFAGGLRHASPAALFCVIALALSAAGTLFQARYYFDRYVLVLLPLAVASVTALAPRVAIGLASIAAWALVAAWSVAGTHDYLEWNRARWALLEGLEARGVDAASIDGGFEYNASRLAAKLRTHPTDAEARRGQPASVKSWWWVQDDSWIVAFRPLDGYAEADSRTYTRWLPPGRGRVLLLRREGVAEGRDGAARDAAAFVGSPGGRAPRDGSRVDSPSGDAPPDGSPPDASGPR